MKPPRKILNFKSRNKYNFINKDAIKDYLSIAKDIIDITWKLGPLSLALAGLFIWIYLKNIRWSALFYDSVMTGTGLIFLVLATIIITVLFLSLLAMPSIIMAITLSYFEKKQKIKKEISILYWISFFSWILVVNASLFLKSSYAWIFIIPILITFIYGITNSKKINNSTQISTNAKKYNFPNAIIIIILSNIAMLGIFFPIFLFLGIASNHTENSYKQIYNSTVIFFLISLVSLAPGMMYLTVRTIKSVENNQLKILLSVSSLFFYFTFFLIPIFTPVSKIILETTEIYNNNKKEFQVTQDNLKRIIKHTKITAKYDEDVTIISAYIRYSFAGTKLVCNEPLEFIDFSNSPSKNKNESGTLSCIATGPGDLREFRK